MSKRRINSNELNPGEIHYLKPGEKIIPLPRAIEDSQTQVLDVASPTSTELPPKPEIVAMPPEIGRFIPPACCMCAAIVPENRRTTYIEGTKRVVNGPDEMVITRSIRCDKCGNTWTHKELIRHRVDS